LSGSTFTLAQILPDDSMLKHVLEAGSAGVLAACLIYSVRENAKANREIARQAREHADSIESNSRAYTESLQQNLETMLQTAKETSIATRSMTDAVMQLVTSQAKMSTRYEQMVAVWSSRPCGKIGDFTPRPGVERDNQG